METAGDPRRPLAPPSRPRAPLDVTLLATFANATALRRSFRTWAAPLLTETALCDLTLAVYEALANAAEHAHTAHAAPGTMRLQTAVIDEHVEITITDDGAWRPPTGTGTGTRGRGLTLIHHLVPDTRIEPTPSGTTVRLRYAVTTAAS